MADTQGPQKPDGLSFTVAILTYQRPDDLRRCLDAVRAAINESAPLFFELEEILVVDNDPNQTGGEVLADPVESAHLSRYICEPKPGVANARNRALAECRSPILIFIDDDEVPGEQWPNGLLQAMDTSGAALVGGPVDTVFADQPPDWITKGDFFARQNPPHLSPQAWLRSGNLAIDVTQVRAASLTFDPRMTVSEDVAFSRAARAGGLDLVWSQNGSVSEYVGHDRFSVAWRLRREYRAQQGWAMVTAALGDQERPRLRTVARGLQLMATGSLKLAKSLLPPSKASAVHAIADLFGGVGRLSGLWAAWRR